MWSAGKKPKKNASDNVYPTPEATPAPEIPNWNYQATVEDEHSGQPAASGSTTGNTPHSKSATPGSEQLPASGSTTQQAQNTNSAHSKSATPSPEHPAASGSTTGNTPHSKSATPGSEQLPASGSTTQQAQNTNSAHSKSAKPSPEQPAASGSTTHRPEEPNVLPDPDIPLPSIENEAGQEMLYMRRRAARKHVMACKEKDFWAMLDLNPAHTTQMQAATMYRRLSFLIHPDKQKDGDRSKAAKAQASMP